MPSHVIDNSLGEICTAQRLRGLVKSLRIEEFVSGEVHFVGDEHHGRSWNRVFLAGEEAQS